MLPPPHEWLPSPSTSSYHTYIIAALVRAQATSTKDTAAICLARLSILRIHPSSLSIPPCVSTSVAHLPAAHNNRPTLRLALSNTDLALSLDVSLDAPNWPSSDIAQLSRYPVNSIPSNSGRLLMLAQTEGHDLGRGHSEEARQRGGEVKAEGDTWHDAPEGGPLPAESLHAIWSHLGRRDYVMWHCETREGEVGLIRE